MTALRKTACAIFRFDLQWRTALSPTQCCRQIQDSPTHYQHSRSCRPLFLYYTASNRELAPLLELGETTLAQNDPVVLDTTDAVAGHDVVVRHVAGLGARSDLILRLGRVCLIYRYRLLQNGMATNRHREERDRLMCVLGKRVEPR